MSETSTMPFQPGTVADVPLPPDEEESPGNQRLLLILGAVAGLVVLAIAAYFLLFAGGSDDKATDAALPAANPSTQPSTVPSAAPVSGALPKISAKNFGTDPFKALISEAPVTNPTGTGAGTATGTGTSTTGTTPVVTPPVDTGTGTSPTPPVATSFRFRVANVATDNESARVKVDGTASTVSPGEVFSEKFKAIRFTGGTCGTFQFGDERFDLCEGNTVTVN
jgi:hypothetical protein